jgi:hypothetical protein
LINVCLTCVYGIGRPNYYIASLSPKILQGEGLAIKSCCGAVDCYAQPEFCIIRLGGVIYENCRPDYLNTFLDKLISWEAVAGHLAQAKAFVNLGEPTIPEK